MMTIKEIALGAAIVLAPVFLTILGWAAAKFAAFVNAHVANKELAGVLTRLDYAVVNAVKQVEQTTVSAMRATDGSITVDAAMKAKSAALGAVKAYLGAEGWKAILDVLGLAPQAGEVMLAGRVEAAVHDLKATTLAPGVVMNLPGKAAVADAVP